MKDGEDVMFEYLNVEHKGHANANSLFRAWRTSRFFFSPNPIWNVIPAHVMTKSINEKGDAVASILIFFLLLWEHQDSFWGFSCSVLWFNSRFNIRPSFLARISAGTQPKSVIQQNRNNKGPIAVGREANFFMLDRLMHERRPVWMHTWASAHIIAINADCRWETRGMLKANYTYTAPCMFTWFEKACQQLCGTLRIIISTIT